MVVNLIDIDSAQLKIPDTIKPPPHIYVKGVENFPELCLAIIDLIDVNNLICKLATYKLKIQTSNPNVYRALVHFLKDKKAKFHTYQLKKDKPLGVIIHNLHPTTPLNIIKEGIVVCLFEVRQVTNVLHKVTKNYFLLVFIDLEPTTKSNEIVQLLSLLHIKIKIEKPYKSKAVSKILNFQQYGHTKAY